jgi:ribosomal protein L37AE/L43A
LDVIKIINMGYKNENIKHKAGFSSFTHKCPECGHKMKWVKVPFIVQCGKCSEVTKGDDLVKLK